MYYTVQIERAALASLKKLSIADRRRVTAAIDALAGNPRPRGAIQLKGQRLYRLRVGRYRVVYEVRDNVLLVIVVRVTRRAEDTYKGLS
ncbi:MAG: type II toxin-antitoxin system RelE/ParE family toxin [Anaerolineae bacterium]|nr:type II toxin-antitoxin system RelE/ParE family toxin [Anaerolineae bacterium]